MRRQSLAISIVVFVVLSTFGSACFSFHATAHPVLDGGRSDEIGGDVETPSRANGTKNALEDSGFLHSENAPIVRYHPMNRGEMERMRSAVGIRQPGVNYNPIVNGHGTGLAPPTEEQWNEKVGNTRIVDDIVSAPSLPPAVDLSTDQCFPAVGDQMQQGSCAAWAAAYYTYGYLEAKDNGWTDAHAGNTAHLMSPAWVYNRANGGYDSGSWMSEDFQVSIDWGTATLATQPYNDQDLVNWGGAAAFREAPYHRASAYTEYSFSSDSTGGDQAVTLVKSKVAAGTPVTFALNSIIFSQGFDGDYVIAAAEIDWTGFDHAQTVVGYNDGIVDHGEVGAFRIVNSWGSGWGESGYYWLTFEAFKKINSRTGLFLTEVTDIADYEPSMVAVWHFNNAPSRDGGIEIGIGAHTSPAKSKLPYYASDSDHTFPTFMCLDISEFTATYMNGTEDFFLDVGTSSQSGTISSFRIERYEDGYVPGMATQVSSQSADVPVGTPDYVSNALYYYSPIPINEAVDDPVHDYSTGGFAGWVGVDHQYYDGNDALQSGDVGDGGSTQFSTNMTGPITVSFYWKVSSQAGLDRVRFCLDGTEVVSISGEADWHEITQGISVGIHTLTWEYVKNSATSQGEDCGWLDKITMTVLNDSEAPTTAAALSGTLGSGDWYKSSVTVRLSASDGNGSGIKSTSYQIDGGSWKEYSAPFSVSNDGQHHIEYFSVDNFNNTENTKSESFKIDSSAPSTESGLSGTAGANGWYVSVVEVSLTASDTVSGVQYTRFRTDGGTWHDYSTPIFVSGDGRHKIDYYSGDMAGNTGVTESLEVDIDSLKSGTISTLQGSLGQNGWYVSAVDVTLNASDATSGVQMVRYRIDGGTWCTYSSALGIATGGQHVVEYYSVDAAGNAEDAKSVNVWVDLVGPITDIELSGSTGSAGWYKSSVAVNIFAADEDSGINRTVYRVDGGAWEYFTEPFTVRGEGEHSVEYYSLDDAGNLELVKTTTVGIDTIAPTGAVSLSGTEGLNGWYVSEVTVNLSASDDDGSGVSGTMYKIDGSQWIGYECQFEISETGTHELSFYSIDIGGNSQIPVVMTVKIDKDPPELIIDSDAGKLSATSHDVPIVWSSSDTVSSLDSIQIKIDDGDFVVYPGSQTNITLRNLPDGQHTFKIRAVDVAGNTVEQTMTIDVNTNPFDPEGPMGPWLLIGIVALLLVILIAVVVYVASGGRKGRQ